ncbi:SHOCT domain-containing protein [Plasmodiophora brassicae]
MDTSSSSSSESEVGVQAIAAPVGHGQRDQSEFKPKGKKVREFVSTEHISALADSYYSHFEHYCEGRKKAVTQVIPGAVWKQVRFTIWATRTPGIDLCFKVYAEYRQKFPDSTFCEANLKVRLRDTLLELKTGTSNMENVPKRELQAKSVIERLKTLDSHCKRNVIQLRDSIVQRKTPEKKPRVESPSPPDTAAPKNKAQALSCQAMAFTQIAKAMHDRGRLTESRIKQTELSNLKELRDAGVISDEEFRQKARTLMGL